MAIPVPIYEDGTSIDRMRVYYYSPGLKKMSF
jgi:hypothetical protein